MEPEVGLLSPDEDSVMPDQALKYRRSLKSLRLLATRFVEFLQEAEGGVVDLRQAVTTLAVEHKRRIYDITNVLEGIGLIVKISKNVVKWLGTGPGENLQNLSQRLSELRSELGDLEQIEFMLDQQRQWVEESIRNTTEDCSKSTLTYVNHEDICNCFSDHTLLAVRAPLGTQLDVPIPKAVQNSPAKYQIYLKSVRGPIDVLLLNKHSASSVPVALPVPPLEYLLRNAKLAMSTSVATESSTTPCQASADAKHRSTSRQTAKENMQPHRAYSFISAEPKRMDTPLLQNLSKELKDLLDPSKEIKSTDLITRLMASKVFSPLLRVPPPPSQREHVQNLDESEGLCGSFDMPVLNVRP